MTQQKTEQPTPRKLDKAREKGEVAKSRELATAAVVLASAATLFATASHVREMLASCFDLAFDAIALDSVSLTGVLEASAVFGVRAAAPVLLAAAVAGGLAVFLQVGPLVSFQRIQPKWERLDPIKGLRQLFTRRQFVELVKTVLKISLIGYVAWITLRDGVRDIAGLASLSGSEATLAAAGELTVQLFLRVGGVITALAILDFFYQRWQFRQDQKMTKDEVKREYKESEGDPHQKQERARVHREILEHATLEDVRRADVLVVNPTHYAVALSYDDEAEQEAPEVVAKGQDHLARRMIEAAQEAGVPIMRDVPLAQSLYDLDVGTEIPEDLYEAVAAILHAAWQERGEGL